MDSLEEDLQQSRSRAEDMQRDSADARAALQEAREETEVLRADTGRCRFRLGDLQQTLEHTQVCPPSQPSTQSNNTTVGLLAMQVQHR